MSMPSRGRTKEQKRALIKDTADAVVKDFDVTADAVLVEIIESSRDNKAKGGVLFSERRAASADLPEIGFAEVRRPRPMFAFADRSPWTLRPLSDR